MHFSIPESQEVRSTEGTYLIYRLHANGHFQAAIRFRQFLALHNQLTKHYKGIPSLPPKKLLSLSPIQQEERRIGLEKYIQQVSEIVGKSALLYGFLRHAQLESSGESLAKKEIHVYLPNGERFTFSVWNNSPTSSLLRMLTGQIKLNPRFVSFFALLIFEREPNGNWNIVRKLEDYESPYISLAWLGSDHRIILRKWSWNQSIEDELMQDPIGLNLLYLQTVCDIEAGWISVPKESLRTLCALENEGKKHEYLQIVRALKFYGSVKFANCETNFPVQSSIVDIHIGYKEIIFITASKDIIIFRISRIKSWRITLLQHTEGPYKAELSFEYLQSINMLKWISIESAHSLLIALCLHEIVTEMVHSTTKIGIDASNSNEQIDRCAMKNHSYYFERKTGEHVPITDDAATTTGTGTNSSISLSSITSSMTGGGGHQHQHNNTSVPFSLMGTSTNGSTSSSSSTKSQPSNYLMENSVFADIGDDDL